MTTIGIGGPARWLIDVESVEKLGEALAWARGRDIPLFLLGGGSNVLIADEGFDGLVIHNRITGVDSAHDGGAVLLRVGAGESWDALVERAVERCWGGIEALSGIPGSVAPVKISTLAPRAASALESSVT